MGRAHLACDLGANVSVLLGIELISLPVRSGGAARVRWNLDEQRIAYFQSGPQFARGGRGVDCGCRVDAAFWPPPDRWD